VPSPVGGGRARAYAQPASASAGAAARLAAGERLFTELEYARAVAALVPVTRDARADRAQRLRAWELIALSRFILGDRAGARTAFERVLEIDPGFQLRDTSGSPRIREFFTEVRVSVLGAAGDVELEHAAPRAAAAGGRLELEVRVVRGARAVHDVVVHTREVGTLGYAAATARRLGDARWRATVRLAPADRAVVWEYFAEARAADGVVLARIAAPDAPLAITIAAGRAGGSGDGSGTPTEPRWYRRWYVVAGAAALGAGLTGLVAYSLTRGPEDGTLPPGGITVTP
jgi:hypothetical protein